MHYHQLVIHQNKLFIFGGYDGRVAQDIILILDLGK